MFGMFKKKPPVPEPVTPEGRVVRGAANLLELALMLCRSTPDYQAQLHSLFVRGYLIGFFDAALQCAGVQVKSDEQFFTLMLLGHTQLLVKDIPDSTAYTFDSLRLQGSPDFDSAQTAGGQEYFEFYSGKTRTPVLLSSYFHGSRNMENLLDHHLKNNQGRK